MIFSQIFVNIIFNIHFQTLFYGTREEFLFVVLQIFNRIVRVF
jgi:hypothetical protein